MIIKKIIVKGKPAKAGKNQKGKKTIQLKGKKPVKGSKRKVTADVLDKDLDKYFLKNGDKDKCKNSLDMELDEYMKKGDKDKKAK
jgi:hypothetical protein